MEIILAEPALVRRVEQWGQETNRSAEKILETAVQAYLDELEREAIRAETQAFWAMYDDLLKKYPEQHIALYQGKIVAHDKDVSRLEERVRGLFGLLPVLIAPVRPSPARDLLWLGGRVDRSETT